MLGPQEIEILRAAIWLSPIDRRLWTFQPLRSRMDLGFARTRLSLLLAGADRRTSGAKLPARCGWVRQIFSRPAAGQRGLIYAINSGTLSS
jgi:hypothetical protein